MGWFSEERLSRLRMKQEASFTPIFLHRPLAIAALYPLVDVAWITPNRITAVSIAMRFVAAALLWPSGFGGVHETPVTLWSAILLWHVGSVLDAMDGALARYRGLSSGFGRFIDKVPDRIVALMFILSLSARAYLHANEVLPVFLGMIYISLSGTTSVAKWIDLGIRASMVGGVKAADGNERSAPSRTPMQWVLYWLWSLRTIFVVTEMDLPLWGSIAAVTGKETWLLAYLAVSQIVNAASALTSRSLGLWRFDKELAAKSSS